MALDVAPKIAISGWVEVIVRDRHGKPKYVVTLAKGNPTPIVPKGVLPETQVLFYFRKNVVTNAGLAEIIKLVFNLGGTPFEYVAIGTGTTSESATDTALENEIARKKASVSQTTTTITNDTALLEATFSKADGLSGSKTISEAGVFNASSGGTLLARKTFTGVPVNFDAGDSITIRYYIQMSR
ncbi:MAG: hypothetical protein DRO12_06505 [Thermoprotei archaeon]|nr:MAG: hypothetical protein DRO12_06505 [Thermoprotei archaeon]